MPRHGVEDLTYPIPRPGKPGRGTQGGPDGLAHGVAGDSASGAAELTVSVPLASCAQVGVMVWVSPGLICAGFVVNSTVFP